MLSSQSLPNKKPQTGSMRLQKGKSAWQEDKWKNEIEPWIGEHPLISLGTALAIGVYIGWMLKRR